MTFRSRVAQRITTAVAGVLALSAVTLPRTSMAQSAGTSDSAPSDSALMARGLAAARDGGAKNAVTTFREILQRTPSHYGAQYQLAAALDLAGQPTNARVEWQHVLDAADRIGDSTTIATARRRLAAPDTVSQATMMAAGLDLLYDQRKPALAVTAFRGVLQRNPSHYGAHFQLATALDRAGNATEARAWWSKLLPMAQAIEDRPTLTLAKARLARTQ